MRRSPRQQSPGEDVTMDATRLDAIETQHRQLIESYELLHHELQQNFSDRRLVTPFSFAHVRGTLEELRDGYAFLRSRLSTNDAAEKRVANLLDQIEDVSKAFASRPVWEFAKRAAPNAVVASVTTAASGIGLSLSDVCICWLWKSLAGLFPAWILLTLVYPFHRHRHFLLRKQRNGSAGVGSQSIAEREEQLLRFLDLRPSFQFQWDIVGLAVVSLFYFLYGSISGHHAYLRYHADLILGGTFAGIAILTLLGSMRRPYAWNNPSEADAK